ncbi:MAG: ATPase [Thaumarchaeota archaeon]|nr:ATPase [Nitrososphaerota archaeon]|tara:strand:- start:1046 stop:2080 length:1035 start_codon:yes stop_codon:yes gene_type:complete
MPHRIFGSVKSFTAKGKLLYKDSMHTLAESRDIDELVTRIKNTIYLDAVSKLQKPYTAVSVENALREDLVNFHASMANIAGGSDVLNAYFVRYIIWNLKVILKGKASGRLYEEILPHVNLRAEELVGRRDIIVKALVGKDLDEAITSLAGSEFGDDAQKAVNIYKEKGDLQVFDVFLDHVFYKALAKGLATSGKETDVKAVVIPEIDAYNVLSILRAKFWGLNEQQVKEIVVGATSTITDDIIQKMIKAENINDAMIELGNTVYKDITPQLTNDIEIITNLERSFEEILFRKYLGTFRKMFNYATMISIIKLKMIEVRNLAIIASAVELKVPTDNVMSKLLLVE